MAVNFSFTVPGSPPSTNHLYVRVRGQYGKMAKAPGVEKYQQDVWYIARSAKPSGWHAEGQIRVRFRMFLRHRIDADNAMKALLDAVAKALEVDDDRFLPCVEEKRVWKNEPNPRIEISVEPLSSQPPPG